MSQDAYRNIQLVVVEDGSFQKGVTKKSLLAVVLFKGLKIESVKIAKITVDGLDATKKLSKILDKWDFASVLLAGVSFGGFNIIDPTVIYEKFCKPVIIISRTKPDNMSVKRALQRHFRNWETRWKVFEKLGPVYKIAVLADEPSIYIETVGTNKKWAQSLIQALTICGKIPEPIRVARLIARGLS